MLHVGQTLPVTGEWSIGRAEELRALLAGFLEPGEDIVLDLGGMETCDTAVVQLFYALRVGAQRRGLGLRIAAVSPAVAATAEALGLRLEELRAANGL